MPGVVAISRTCTPGPCRHVPAAVTAVLSGDGRRILLRGGRSLAGAAAALRSAAVLDRCVLREDGAPLAGAHLDALGLYFRCLGDHDLQHAVLHRGFDLVRLYVTGERDRTAEGTVI